MKRATTCDGCAIPMIPQHPSELQYWDNLTLCSECKQHVRVCDICREMYLELKPEDMCSKCSNLYTVTFPEVPFGFSNENWPEDN